MLDSNKSVFAYAVLIPSAAYASDFGSMATIFLFPFWFVLFVVAFRAAFRSANRQEGSVIILICTVFAFLLEFFAKSKSYTSDNIFGSLLFLIPFVLLLLKTRKKTIGSE
jgi:glycopeptide antibiotics resistance protein